jgi:transglutaminase-like putative cysteine protease
VARLGALPEGKAGTVATLRIMRQLVRDAIRAPAQTIRRTALDLYAGLPPRQWIAEVERLHRFVRDHIRYVRDPVGVESVATPEKTLELGTGDCDDKSVLLAALLESTGHPARFLAVGLNGGPLSHVLVQSKIGPQWISLETIIPVKMGWHPNGVTSNYILGI